MLEFQPHTISEKHLDSRLHKSVIASFPRITSVLRISHSNFLSTLMTFIASTELFIKSD